MYEEYTDEQIVEMLIPKMNKCSERTKWDGLIEKPWGNADLFKVVATIYRSGYIRGQLGRSFIIGEKKKKWERQSKSNSKAGAKIRIAKKTPGDYVYGYIDKITYDEFGKKRIHIKSLNKNEPFILSQCAQPLSAEVLVCE